MENQTEVQIPQREFKNPMADWLRQAADRHDRIGEPVWATLFRNEAYLMEGKKL